MNRPTFYVAKFIPDLIRNEPRNVGVILWTSGRLTARFLGEVGEGGQGLDSRFLRGLTSANSYRRWVTYLRNQLNSLTESLCPDPGEVFSTLSSKLNEAFFLVEGGMLFEDVKEVNIRVAVDNLFQKFVKKSQAMGEALDLRANVAMHRAPGIEGQFRELLVKTGVDKSPFLFEKPKYSCRITDRIEEELEFSWAFANGALHRVMQTVELPNAPDAMQKNVHDTAWKFEKIVDSGIIGEDRVVSILRADARRMEDPKVYRNIDLLRSVGQVWNLADDEASTNEVASLPALSMH